MPNGDGGDRRQCLHALHRLQHTAGIGAHQAVVVEAEVGRYGAGIHIEHVVGAVVQSEGVAGVEDARAVVIRKNRVGPVEVGGAQEFKAVLNAAGWIGAQIELMTAFHSTALERAMHLVLQELDRNLRAHDLDLGIEIDQVADQTRVIGFGMTHDQVIDGHRVALLLQQRQPGAFELEVACVDQGGALTPHQKAVVGGAIAQTKLDVEAVAVPVERADGGAVGADHCALEREAVGGHRQLGRLAEL